MCSGLAGRKSETKRTLAIDWSAQVTWWGERVSDWLVWDHVTAETSGDLFVHATWRVSPGLLNGNQ